MYIFIWIIYIVLDHWENFQDIWANIPCPDRGLIYVNGKYL